MIDFDSPHAPDAVTFGRWAFIHELADGAALSYKVDVELFRDFDCNAAVRSLCKKSAVPVLFLMKKKRMMVHSLLYIPMGRALSRRYRPLKR